jgi:hypothetical protein
VDTATDVQGPLVTLPIIQAWHVTVDRNHTGTPTFSWPDVAPGNYYRVMLFDDAWNTIFLSSRSPATTITIPHGTLPAGINYQARVEVHDTYNGKEITFKAMARGGDGTYMYEWDFNGDGVYDFSATTNNRYDLSAKHTYPDQLFDKIFIARIRVNSGGNIVTAEYPVRAHATATQSVRVNVAIDEALWWMHQKMLRWDSGSVQYGALTDQMLGSTGAAVQAWENQGHKLWWELRHEPIY